jgi:hypothetical protein
MEIQGAKSSNSSQRSGPVSRDGTHDGANLPSIHPDACLAIRKQTTWLTKTQWAALETVGKPMPSRVFDCLE